MRWEPDRAAPALPYAPPPFFTALGRGAMNRCPVCGQGKVFRGFLKVVPECEACHAPLGRLRADDAPPYFTILLVGHILVPMVLWVEKAWQPPMWLHMALWLPLFTIACTLALRPVKGAVVGWMIRLGIGGAEGDHPEPAPSRTARDG
jgi:uncharacterized protein (DUF983 family)